MSTAGIYIHVPFCKSRCIYCDFYSTTLASDVQSKYAEALCNELKSRASYLPHNKLDSLYIGGGTPSILHHDNLEKIFKAVESHFELKPDAEVTIEVNPDDVTEEFALGLKSLPINRVSMGVQTFNNEMLKLLNRRHNASQVDKAIEHLIKVGINNISIDLIYGLPNQTMRQWEDDINKAFSLPISHLSAYALIYEEGTRLYKMRERGEVAEADEELSLQMYEALMNKASENGFYHYEISNFAKPQLEAHHNSGYWNGMLYLGLAPGAHSYNGTSRQWNNPDLANYIKANGNVEETNLCETEILDNQMKMEESILTQLRTAGGLDLSRFGSTYGQDKLQGLLSRAETYINKGELTTTDIQPKTFIKTTEESGKKASNNPQGFLCLTRKGLFISDDIMSSLFED